MPPKIRELIWSLEKAGFEFEPGKGSHRKFRQPVTAEVVVISGQLSDDSRPYQEKEVRAALANCKIPRRAVKGQKR